MNAFKGVLVLFCFLLMFTPIAWSSECPDGKVPLQLITPSGNQRTICVSGNAIEGIENASENSSGLVIPISCPCWNDKDVSYYAGKGSFYCAKEDFSINCYQGDFHVFVLTKDLDQALCGDVDTGKTYIDDNEYASCLELIKDYYNAPK